MRTNQPKQTQAEREVENWRRLNSIPVDPIEDMRLRQMARTKHTCRTVHPTPTIKN